MSLRAFKQLRRYRLSIRNHGTSAPDRFLWSTQSWRDRVPSVKILSVTLYWDFGVFVKVSCFSRLCGCGASRAVLRAIDKCYGSQLFRLCACGQEHPEDMQHIDSCEYIWEAGVGFAHSPQHNASQDRCRTELLKLILTCFSETMYLPPQGVRPTFNPSLAMCLPPQVRCRTLTVTVHVSAAAGWVPSSNPLLAMLLPLKRVRPISNPSLSMLLPR